MDMASRRIDVFFYGLFMDVALLQQQGIQPSNVRRARVEGFDLVIAERATLVPRAAHTVFGVLISLTHEDVTHLYTDASVQDYRPEAVLAITEDGQSIPALCYNLTTPPTGPGANRAYAEALLALVQRLGFPDAYQARIRHLTGEANQP
jgi:gamma-glutamyl AIG2-like cyclotransferase